MYPRFLQLFLNQIENLEAVFNDEYDTPSHTKKVFANMRRPGKDFSGTITPLFPSMLTLQVVEGNGSRQPTESQHTPTTASPSHVKPIPTVASLSHPKKTKKHRKTKRKATEISQFSRPTTLVADETIHKERGDKMERAATTASSLEAEQDSGTINRTQSMETLNEPIPQGTGLGSGPRRHDTILGDRPAQTRFESLSKQSNEPPLLRVNTLGSGEDRMKLQEMIKLCTKLSERVLALENIKIAQDLEITNLKKRVKKIESSADKSLGDQEDASNQGRNIAEFDQDEGILFVQEDAKTQGSAPITTAGVSVSTAKPSTPPTTTTLIEDENLTIAQTLMKMKSVKSKEKSKEKGVSSETATRLTRGVIMKEASKTVTRPIVPPQQQLDPKEKDYELAARLQAEEQGELTIEERSRLFVELMDKKKKHFARLGAKE
ncbi:hypothetical protein Tco_1413343 [Tanacetum coccineum]